MTRRAGFTLVELLTVIAIIALLLGLTVPAVMYARESARRAQCQNNLAQIGTALHNFNSAYGHFPEAVPPANARESHSGPLNPPQLVMLPFLEQGAIFGQVDKSPGGRYQNEPPFPALALHTVPTYVCPSDPVPGGNNYRACTGPDAYGLPTSWIRANNESGEGGRGVFVVVKRIRDADIGDGLSNTIGFSEKRKSVTDPHRFDPRTDAWYTGVVDLEPYPSNQEMGELCGSLTGEPAAYHAYAGATWLYVGYHYSLYNHLVSPNADLPDCEANGPGGSPATGGVYKASSYHPGGVHCLLMSGAVRFVSDGIDAGVWRAASTRAGGESDRF